MGLSDGQADDEVTLLYERGEDTPVSIYSGDDAETKAAPGPLAYVGKMGAFLHEIDKGTQLPEIVKIFTRQNVPLLMAITTPFFAVDAKINPEEIVRSVEAEFFQSYADQLTTPEEKRAWLVFGYHFLTLLAEKIEEIKQKLGQTSPGNTPDAYIQELRVKAAASMRVPMTDDLLAKIAALRPVADEPADLAKTPSTPMPAVISPAPAHRDPSNDPAGTFEAVTVAMPVDKIAEQESDPRQPNGFRLSGSQKIILASAAAVAIVMAVLGNQRHNSPDQAVPANTAAATVPSAPSIAVTTFNVMPSPSTTATTFDNAATDAGAAPTLPTATVSSNFAAVPSSTSTSKPQKKRPAGKAEDGEDIYEPTPGRKIDLGY